MATSSKRNLREDLEHFIVRRSFCHHCRRFRKSAGIFSATEIFSAKHSNEKMIANLITLMSEIFTYRKCRNFSEFVKIRDIKWLQKNPFLANYS